MLFRLITTTAIAFQVLVTFPYIIGLSSIDPIAGGLFATLQGSGLVVTGSCLANLQSFIMSGWYLLIQALTFGISVLLIIINVIFYIVNSKNRIGLQ